jgi:hypothetical protein
MVTRWTKDGKYCWGQPTASHTIHFGSDVYFWRGGAAGVPRYPRQNTAALPLSYDLGVLQRNLAAHLHLAATVAANGREGAWGGGARCARLTKRRGCGQARLCPTLTGNRQRPPPSTRMTKKP